MLELVTLPSATLQCKGTNTPSAETVGPQQMLQNREKLVVHPPGLPLHRDTVCLPQHLHHLVPQRLRSRCLHIIVLQRTRHLHIPVAQIIEVVAGLLQLATIRRVITVVPHPLHEVVDLVGARALPTVEVRQEMTVPHAKHIRQIRDQDHNHAAVTSPIRRRQDFEEAITVLRPHIHALSASMCLQRQCTSMICRF